MHIEYATEQLEYAREQAKKYEWNVTPEFYFCSNFLIPEQKFLEWVIEKGNEKSAEISKTIISKRKASKFFKATEKQKYVICMDIISKFTIEEVLKSLFNDKEII
jgi:hypothetical protein